MLTIWLICLTGHIAKVKFDVVAVTQDDKYVSTFPIALIVIFAFLWLNPYEAIMFKKARVQLLKTLQNIVIAPFGLVKFKHFILNDILISLTSVLQQLGLVYCYFTDEKRLWYNSKNFSIGVCG